MSCSLAGQSMLAFLTWHLAGVVPNLVGIRTIGSNWDTDAYFMIFLVDEIWGSWTNIHCNRWVFEILETSLTWWLTAICISIIQVLGIDNGLGLIPPRGWRSWNAFDCLESLGSRATQCHAFISITVSTWPMAFIEDEDHPHTGAYDGANGCSVG